MRKFWVVPILIMAVLLTACATPTPKVVKKVVKQTVVVTKEVEKVVTKEVEKVVTKEVQKVVTKEVEKIVTKEVPTSKGVVTVLGVWGGDEYTNFRDAVLPFTDKTGIGMAFEGTRDLAAVLTTRIEAGNPPDLAILPNPGQLYELAAEGKLVPLDSFMNKDQLVKDYGQSWVDIASYNGHVYGIFYKVAVKSLVWYNPKTFAAKGYKVPKTWDEMMALSDKIVADGGTPWCIGLESGSASGWPGTDWIEDIMLRTAGPKVYDQWVRHEIPWTDPAVKTAWEYFGKIARNDKYVYGGTTGELSTNFGDAPRPLFDNPPGCYMHRQASFITGFFPKGLKAGKDYDFFPFPPINKKWGTPALVAGDVIVMLNNTPEARHLVQYLASPAPQTAWAKKGGFISANKNVSLDVYPDELTRKMAKMIVSAKVARFDGSDMMPAAVGSGAFWKGVLDYVGGTDLNSVLEEIEAAAKDAYKK